MRLTELNTDEALDVLCGISPSITEICCDEDLMKELKKKLFIDQSASMAERAVITLEKVNSIVPILLKKRRSNVYEILAALNGMTVEEIAKQNMLKTMYMVRDAAKDKDLIDFFRSCVAVEREE